MKRCVFSAFLVLSLFTSCRKDQETAPDDNLIDEQLEAAILTDFSDHVARANYTELEQRLEALHSAAVALQSSPDAAKLGTAREAWRSARAAWERSEAFLFGPVSTENIDPSTDTWPVDYLSLDSLLASSLDLSPTNIHALGDELKGYHPTEYLLWGTDGNKQPSQFTVRELEYLVALTADLKDKGNALRASWDASLPGNYGETFSTAGGGNPVYATRRAAFEELVNGIAGICDEVANGKIGEPFFAQDPTLEESPFSDNSLSDFTNNLVGVRNVYRGDYSTDGKGIQDYLQRHNLSLHNTISAQIDQAIASLSAITVPFGEAIVLQPSQVQMAIDKINILKTTLDEELLPYLQQKLVR
jgi:predicted lipoprotein